MPAYNNCFEARGRSAGIDTSQFLLGKSRFDDIMWVCLFEDGAAPHTGPAVGYGSAMKEKCV
jgi:hypothetical protein